MQRLSGGESSDCFAFALTEAPPGTPTQLVLRLMRDDRSAARELAIQRAVRQHGLPVPQIFHAGTSVSAFGRPYCIMQRVAGGDVLKEGAIRRLPNILAETMARLHALPVDGLQATVTAEGVPADEADVDRVVHELALSPDGGVVRAAQWFERNAVTHTARVLCHGDLHARNLLLDRGALTAVLDWEIAAFAPREYDVARTELLLLMMPGVGPAMFRPLVRLLGRRAAARFVDAYRTRTAIDAALLDRCRALHVLRLIALVRTDGGSEGVRRLWRPYETALVRRWLRLTGEHM